MRAEAGIVTLKARRRWRRSHAEHLAAVDASVAVAEVELQIPGHVVGDACHDSPGEAPALLAVYLGRSGRHDRATGPVAEEIAAERAPVHIAVADARADIGREAYIGAEIDIAVQHEIQHGSFRTVFGAAASPQGKAGTRPSARRRPVESGAVAVESEVGAQHVSEMVAEADAVSQALVEGGCVERARGGDARGR